MKSDTPKKPGRPVGWRKPNGRDARKDLRLSGEELAAWKRAARKSGKTLNQWIRDCCNCFDNNN